MGRDRIKEELSGLRLFFTAFFAAAGSVIAWVVQHRHTAETILVVCGWAIVVGLAAALVAITRRMYRQYLQLEGDT